MTLKWKNKRCSISARRALHTTCQILQPPHYISARTLEPKPHARSSHRLLSSSLQRALRSALPLGQDLARLQKQPIRRGFQSLKSTRWRAARSPTRRGGLSQNLVAKSRARESRPCLPLGRTPTPRHPGILDSRSLRREQAPLKHGLPHKTEGVGTCGEGYVCSHREHDKIRVHPYMQVCLSIRICICSCTGQLHVFLFIHLFVNIKIQSLMAYVLYIYIYIHIYIYTYIHIYIYTQIHRICTDTYIQI